MTHDTRARLAALGAVMLLTAGAGPAAPQWHKGYFPNVVLTTQTGRKVRFYDDVIKGKVVAINFIFTSCTDICPMDTAALRRVQKLLGPRVGRDVFFYSISVDPTKDTPAALARYMKTFDVGPGWTFLTGRPQDILLIQQKFGIRPVTPSSLSAHDTRFVLGNEAIARWIKRTPHDNPHVLAHILTRDLPGPGAKSTALPPPDYASAAPIVGLTASGSLFMTRCSACHSIGGGDDKLGPDLAGIVQRRPRAWLHRWIKAPDRMRAERDPTVRALVARYRNLPMPNQKLSDADVAGLIDFLDAESRRHAASIATRSMPANGAHHHHHE